MGKMYFATDGSYGDATDMLIVDTDTLTQEDLDDIVNASDNGRLQLVQSMVSCMGLPDVAEDIGLSGSHQTPVQHIIASSIYYGACKSRGNDVDADYWENRIAFWTRELAEPSPVVKHFTCSECLAHIRVVMSYGSESVICYNCGHRN